jgi:uncharacterized glyoxalase superfamily protein PhnB
VPNIPNPTGTKFAPVLRYLGVAAAVEWLCTAFGFEKHGIVAGEDGEVLHAHLTFGDHMIMVLPAHDSGLGRFIKQPDEVGGAETQSCYIVVDDADAHYRKAKAAGAAILLDISDDDHGGRGYACRDPEGHIWSFGTYDPWPSQPRSTARSAGLGRGLVMAATLVCVTAAAATAGWMLPRAPTLSAAEIRLRQEAATTLQGAEQEEKRAMLLAAELAQERSAKDAAERAAREAREVLTQEQSAKKAAEISTRQLEAQLAATRRSNEAAEQKAREAGAQFAIEQTARQTAERTVSEATKDLDRERDAKQQAERAAQNAIEQLAREQRAKDEAETAATQAREQLAQTQNAKSDGPLGKDGPVRLQRQRKADDRVWDCQPRPPNGQVICRPVTSK